MLLHFIQLKVGLRIKHWTWIVVLFMFLWRNPEVALADELISAIEGSTVLLPASYLPKDISVLQWAYIKESTSQHILDYFSGQLPLINRLFIDRVTFYNSNGSLLLKNVRMNDSGIYKVTVNLIEKEARKIQLKVLAPISTALIRSSIFSAGSPIEVICEVSGSVDIIMWKKDGIVLHPDDCYHVSENGSVLSKKIGEKSDCGSFSCNASNERSWNESSFILIVQGVRIILDSSAPVGVVTVLLFSSFLIETIHLLQENGCSPSVDLTLIIVPLALIISFLIVLFAWYHRNRENARQVETSSVPERCEQAQEEQLQVMEEVAADTNGHDDGNEPSHQLEPSA